MSTAGDWSPSRRTQRVTAASTPGAGLALEREGFLDFSEKIVGSALPTVHLWPAPPHLPRVAVMMAEELLEEASPPKPLRNAPSVREHGVITTYPPFNIPASRLEPPGPPAPWATARRGASGVW